MEHTNVTACNDLDTKNNAILSIIVQDDGDTFAKRAEMYYKKRPELIEMVEELQKSYRLLAEKYDQLRSQGMQNHVHGEEDRNRVRYSNFDTKSTAGDHDHEIEFDKDPSNGKAEYGMFTAAESTKSSKVNPADEQMSNATTCNAFQRNISDDSLLMENKLWNELRFKVSELVEDNLSQQAELSHEVPKKTRFRLSWLKRFFCGRSMKSDDS
ncbi:protein NETWORKED 3A-like isoform X2 [Hibiscus syriacus]|uniref:protein NETWORKED 3A-like isoform X2 n=1 Tax=Hibiscus syriacus TaxID=106335 RepID=UPI0019232F2E|nr:protein NETWORKED 3A-like isoform X2 [Hibiscus syriacus]